jgi:uncharacterized protein (TIGR02284 family)
MTATRTLNDLIKTLEDGHEGYAKAAERLAANEASDVGRHFRDLSSQRGELAEQLRTAAQAEGLDISNRGTATGALHRGWMAVKDTLTGDDPAAIIDAAEQGEDHACATFREALDSDDLAPQLRPLVSSQYEMVKAAHDYVSGLKHQMK